MDSVIKKLNLFDFDGTLFRSPEDSPKNKEKFERSTGIPWLIDKEASRRLSKEHGRHIGMRRGWWGRPETLEPPLVPSPAPKEWFVKEICDKFVEVKKDLNAVTLIMTGRFTGLKGKVLRILHEGKDWFSLEKTVDKQGNAHYQWADSESQIYFLSDDGPRPKGTKPADTFGWKVWILNQFIDLNPTIDHIEIWEDREEHVTNFKELQGSLVEKVTVNHVQA